MTRTTAATQAAAARRRQARHDRLAEELRAAGYTVHKPASAEIKQRADAHHPDRHQAVYLAGWMATAVPEEYVTAIEAWDRVHKPQPVRYAEGHDPECRQGNRCLPCAREILDGRFPVDTSA